jgi:hypothetical protein
VLLVEEKYWKAICCYGHVGHGSEVSVARFLVTDTHSSILDVYSLASDMPGVKNRGVIQIHPIDRELYEVGKKNEESNFYLKKLKNYNSNKKGEQLYA